MAIPTIGSVAYQTPECRYVSVISFMSATLEEAQEMRALMHRILPSERVVQVADGYRVDLGIKVTSTQASVEELKNAVNAFASARFLNFPRSFSSIDEKMSTFIHPKEIELLYLEELRSIDQLPCETRAEQATWVRILLSPERQTFDVRKNNVHWDLKNRFKQVCQTFSDFKAFHKAEFEKSPFCQFDSFSAILGKNEESLPIKQYFHEKCTQFRPSMDCFDFLYPIFAAASKALITLHPHHPAIFAANTIAMEYEAVFFPIACQFLEAALDPSKELPTDFNIELDPDFQTFIPPDISDLKPLTQANKEAFLEAARKLTPERRSKADYEEFLQYTVNALPKG